ncbi:MAG TPA: hypothetical protein VJM33_13945 [Microthrixaceae bacterium]|nr:hypothetical protein [Microthrixaceae bacterium]
MFVTSRSPEGDELADVLSGVGIPVTVDADGTVRVDDRPIDGPLLVRAHPNPAELARLVEAEPAPGIVVADRISGAGRDVLRDAGWGWLDRRGHVRVWRPGVRIESDFDAGRRDDRGNNAWTTVGLEIALHALCNPTEPVRARRVAAEIGRSVGTTHELIARFTESGLVGPTTRRPLLPDLFWETAAHWPDDGWIALPVTLEELSDRLGAESLVRVDERAATLGGARIAAAGDLPSRCYLTDPSAQRRAKSLVERDEPSRSWVRAAPVRWLPVLDDHPPDPAHPWRVAHPIVCALRLGGDPSRGREIVESWGIIPGSESR